MLTSQHSHTPCGLHSRVAIPEQLLGDGYTWRAVMAYVSIRLAAGSCRTVALSDQRLHDITGIRVSLLSLRDGVVELENGGIVKCRRLGKGRATHYELSEVVA